MEISCWRRRLLKAIAKRADSLRRISRSVNRRDSMRMRRLPIRSLRTGGFTFGISDRYGPTTSRRAAKLCKIGFSVREPDHGHFYGVNKQRGPDCRERAN